MNYAANAITIRRIDLGEKDRILTLYTRELGKLSAVAKGSRRPGSKLAGASEPFTYSKMYLATGRDLDVLTQAEVKESFHNTKADIKRVAYAVYLLELLNQFVDEREPNPSLYDTLLSTMYVLESGTDPELTARYFELHLMIEVGYEPNFGMCLNCGRPPSGRGKLYFSPSMGGITCPECGVPPSDAIEVSAAVATYVEALKETEPQNLKNLKFPPGAMRDLAAMFKWHIRYRLERDLKSVEFIEAIEREAES